jgi:hypothetical protein
MGRKLDALLGRNSNISKLKNLAKMAISRISILKNQRQVRCSHAQSDVIELLKLGHQERALLRVISYPSLSVSLSLSLSIYICMMIDEFHWISQQVEHVIKEQNMLDAFGMIENYCDLLIERAVLLENKLVSQVLNSFILLYIWLLESTDLHAYSCVFTGNVMMSSRRGYQA